MSISRRTFVQASGLAFSLCVIPRAFAANRVTRGCSLTLDRNRRLASQAKGIGVVGQDLAFTTGNADQDKALGRALVRLAQTFEELRRDGDIPRGFQRLIDAHFRQAPTGQNEVILNREHRLVQRAFRQGVRSPLASVLRMLVTNALTSAGAARGKEAADVQMEDLDWIADALWGQD